MLVGNRPLSSKPWQLQSLPLTHSLTGTLSAAASSSSSFTELCFFCVETAIWIVVAQQLSCHWRKSHRRRRLDGDMCCGSSVTVTITMLDLLVGGSTYEIRRSDLIYVIKYCPDPLRKERTHEKDSSQSQSVQYFKVVVFHCVTCITCTFPWSEAHCEHFHCLIVNVVIVVILQDLRR
jgi:hypothetical protein